MNNSALLDSTLAMDSGVDGSVPENVGGVSNLLSEFNCTTKTSAANAAGIVCLTTASACLVMRLYPDAEVVGKIPRPKDVDASKIPYASFDRKLSRTKIRMQVRAKTIMVTVRTVITQVIWKRENSQSFGAIESPFGSWVFYPQKMCSKSIARSKTKLGKERRFSNRGHKVTQRTIWRKVRA